jgi:hypothetical protein
MRPNLDAAALISSTHTSPAPVAIEILRRARDF